MSNKSFALTSEDVFHYSHLAINKNRLKEFKPKHSFNASERVFYLSGDTEFQIEIFNPTNGTIGVKVSINGKEISSSLLVLYPGQRVWLERDFDSNNKFKFIIYEVEKNNPVVEKAIADNGKIKIEFYREREKPVLTYTDWNVPEPWWKEPLTPKTPDPWSPVITCYNSSISYVSDELNSSSYDCGECSAASTLSAEDCLRELYDNEILSTANATKSTKETGVVGRSDERSKQEFRDVNGIEFDYFPFKTEYMKMLPVSEKRITAEDVNVRRYCSHCGKKLKPTFKFCPACGTKVE